MKRSVTPPLHRRLASVGLGLLAALLLLPSSVRAQSWVRVVNQAGQAGSAIGAGNGNTLYAGLASGHVFRSDNNGVAWTVVTNGLVDNAGRMLLPKAFVVGDGGRVLRGGDNASWANKTGSPVFRTDNQGAVWTEVPLPFGSAAPNPGGIAISDMVRHQGALYFSDLLSSGVWKSTDNGVTWTSVGANLPFVSSVFGITTKTYYAIASAGDALLTVEPLRGVFRSTDGGATWNQSVSGIPGVLNSPIVGGRTWNGWDVTGGADGTAYAVVDNAVYRSRDGGASWVPVGGGLFNARKVEFLGDRVFVSSSDGDARFFEGTAYGESWSELPRIPGGSAGASILAQSFTAHNGALYFAGTNGVYRLDLASANRTPIAPLIPATAATDLFANVGQRITLSVAASGTQPFTYEWRLGSNVLSGQVTATLDYTATAPSAAQPLSVVVRNAAGAVTNTLVRLTVAPVGPGAIDYSFQPQVPTGGAGAPVYAFAVDRDGSVFYGGDLYSLLGEVYRGLRKVLPDGTIDATFNASAGPTVGIPARALLPLGDGSVLVGAAGGGRDDRYWRRLLPGGAIDPEWPWPVEMPGGTYKAKRLPDGRILVAGGSLSGLNRLLPDGRTDPTFNLVGSIGTFQAQRVTDFFVQTDGRIVIAGNFFTIDGQTRSGLARLHPDGGLDILFKPAGFDSRTDLRVLLPLPDGRFLVGGAFTRVANETHRYLVRLNADGTRDATFGDPGFTGPVNALEPQPDGRIWVGGEFTGTSGRNYLLRLSSDGAVDTTFPDLGFAPVSDGGVFSLRYETNGRLWVGGALTTAGAYRCGQFFRIFTDVDAGPLAYVAGDAAPNLGAPLMLSARVVGAGTGIQWRRNGTPIPGENGVQFSRPATALADAGRYDVVVGWAGGSVTSTPVEVRVRGAVVIDGAPADTVGAISNSVSLRVGAFGPLPLQYQWYREGTAVAKATNATLTVTNLSAGLAGDYTVTVTGADGSSATGGPATLTVIPAPGTPNAGFKPGIFALGTFTSTLFSDLQVQADGRILVAGTFAKAPKGTDAQFARLLPDGSLDASFNFSTAETIAVQTVRPLGDGQLLALVRLNQGGAPYVIRRYQSDGTRDAGYAGVTVSGSLAFDVGPEGSAYFSTFSGVGRLTPSGAEDPAFASRTRLAGSAAAVAVDPSGRIYASGQFTVTGAGQAQIVRLLADGTLDTSFNLTNQFFGAWSVRPLDAGVVISDGIGISRFDDAGRRDTSYVWFAPLVVFDRTTTGGLAGVTSGSAGEGVILAPDGRPAVPFGRIKLPGSISSYSVFRSDPNGSFLLALGGSGVPIEPTNMLFRLNGTVTPLAIVTQPVSQKVNQGDTLVLSVGATGTSRVEYQWQRDGADLSGATNATLSVGPATAALNGTYTVVVHNRSGSVTSRPVSVVVLGAPEILSLSPATGALSLGLGEPLVLSVSARGAGLVTSTWRRNGTPLPGGDSPSYTNASVSVGDAGSYDVVVANALGSVTSAPVVVSVVVKPGAVIRGFANVGQAAGVDELALLPGGGFLASRTFAGVAAYSATGVPDPAFTVIGPGFGDLMGRVVVDAPRSRILVALLAPLKTYDLHGAPLAGFNSSPQLPRVVRLEASGTLLIADSTFLNYLYRLETNGTRITSFAPSLGPVIDVRPQPDGKIAALASEFGVSGGQLAYSTRVVRLLADGTVDPTFRISTNAFRADKRALHLQVDPLNRILVFGAFDTYDGQNRSRIARLNPDGTLDASFNPPVLDDAINGVAEQANGKLVIVGAFQTADGLTRRAVARLLPDGSLDSQFDPGAGLARATTKGVASDVKILPSGSILVAGAFDTADGQPRQGVALFTGDSLESAADPFDAWAGEAGLSGADAVPDADPDHDGIPNAAEFVLGTSPTSATSAPAFVVREQSVAGHGYPAVEVVRRQSSGALRVEVSVSGSPLFDSDLGSTEVSSTPLGGGLEKVVIRSNADGAAVPAQFFRVRVQR